MATAQTFAVTSNSKVTPVISIGWIGRGHKFRVFNQSCTLKDVKTGPEDIEELSLSNQQTISESEINCHNHLHGSLGLPMKQLFPEESL